MIESETHDAPARIKASVKILEKREIAEGTLGLYLEKPAGFNYIAGQYVLLHVPHLKEKGGRESTHSMSLASAPFQEHLLIAMRVGPSEFKQAIVSMPIGADLVVDGPFGNLILADDRRPVVFIAGGIGIAPFYSIIQEQARLGWSRQVILFYVNKRPQDAAFLELLRQITNENFKFIPTMSQVPKEDSSWTGEKGRITAPMILKHIKEPAVPLYYVVGSPDMVKATKEELGKLDISSESIKVELFTGYKDQI